MDDVVACTAWIGVVGSPLVLASCSRTRTSWLPPNARSGTMATASWVASSTTVKLLMLQPSAVRSNTKSIDHT